MNVSMPESLKVFVESQVTQRGFGTSSEFIRDLIRQDQAREHLRTLIHQGLESGESIEVSDAYVDSIRARIVAATGAKA